MMHMALTHLGSSDVQVRWLGINQNLQKVCKLVLAYYQEFPFDLVQWPSGKESTCDAGDAGLIPGSGRSPGGGPGNPLQYSCLENSMDRGTWQASVLRVAKESSDWTRTTTHYNSFFFLTPFCWIPHRTRSSLWLPLTDDAVISRKTWFSLCFFPAWSRDRQTFGLLTCWVFCLGPNQMLVCGQRDESRLGPRSEWTSCTWWDVLPLCCLGSPSQVLSTCGYWTLEVWLVQWRTAFFIYLMFIHLHVDIHIWRGFVEVGIHAHPWAGHFGSPGIAWDTSGPQIWCYLLEMKRPHSNSIHESQEKSTINDDLLWRGRVIISRSHNMCARKFQLNHLFCGFQRAMCLLVN